MFANAEFPRGSARGRLCYARISRAPLFASSSIDWKAGLLLVSNTYLLRSESPVERGGLGRVLHSVLFHEGCGPSAVRAGLAVGRRERCEFNTLAGVPSLLVTSGVSGIGGAATLAHVL